MSSRACCHVICIAVSLFLLLRMYYCTHVVNGAVVNGTQSVPYALHCRYFSQHYLFMYLFVLFCFVCSCRHIHSFLFLGQDVENRYQLNGYGIPLDQFPITETGKIKTTNFKKWIQLRKNLEDVNSEIGRNHMSIVECPRSNDVVFRPSQSTMCHPGNVMFRSLVESKHYAHDAAASREEKIDITKGVIQDIKNMGGRFLVWKKSLCWTELTDETQIYSKTAAFFRNSKVSANTRNNRQTSRSSTYVFAGESISRDDKRRKITSSDEDNGSYSSDDDGCACFGIL